MADLELRWRARRAPADPEARVEHLRQLLRSGDLDADPLGAAAHAGDPLAGEVLGVEAPLPPPGDAAALRGWLRDFERFGEDACRQVAVAAAVCEARASWWVARLMLVDELQVWSECPCLDHVRGVEQAASPRSHWGYLRAQEREERQQDALALQWARASIARARSPALTWEELWTRYPTRNLMRLPRLDDEVSRRVSAWGRRAVP